MGWRYNENGLLPFKSQRDIRKGKDDQKKHAA
jgi:hypothetical protein